MRNYITIIIILILFGCKSKEQNNDLLKGEKDPQVFTDTNGREYVIENDKNIYSKNTRKPYTGVLIMYFDNGKIKYEGNIVDGKKNGIMKSYYENGQLQEEGHYKEGKYEGLWRRYFDNGILSIKGNYKDDKQDGFWKSYYDNGQLYLDRIYKDGKLEGFWKSYYDNGQLKYEWNYKEGELISQECWDEDGNEKECD